MNRYSNWIMSLACWDGLLPLAVVASPAVVASIFPGRQGALELTFILVPITAFLLRAWNGRRRFLRGDMFIWQAVVFAIAISLLVLLDAMLIMFHIVNVGRVPVEAYYAWACLFFVYLTLMGVALFPARFEWARDRSVFTIE